MGTMKPRRLLLAIALGCLVALAGVGPAAADAPVFEGPHTEEGLAVIADCGAFQVLDRYVLTYTIARFSDRDGAQRRLIEQLSGTDTFVNSATGEEYPTTFHNTVIVDPAVRIGATTGVIFRLAIPGAGAVFLDVGRVVADRQGNVYFQAGPHQAFDGDLEGLCAALA
jgi:hypothetical protein